MTDPYVDTRDMEQTSEAPRLWTVQEAARFYQVHERTIRNWIRCGELVAERKGRTVRVVPPKEASCR